MLILVAVSLGLGACASTGGDAKVAEEPMPTDEELITALVSESLLLLSKGDIDGMLTYYAEDVTTPQGDKAAMGQFLTMAKDQGLLEGITGDTSAMTVAVEGDSAKVGGVSLEGPFGLLSLTFELAKRDGTWMVTNQGQI
jgi:hypothetical protein